MHFGSCVFKASCRLCLWNLNLWRWRCRLRLENTMATCCRWAELCRAMYLMELLPFFPEFHVYASHVKDRELCWWQGRGLWWVWHPTANGSTLLSRHQQIVVVVSFGSFNDLMGQWESEEDSASNHQGVQPYAYTKTWLRSAIKISGRPPKKLRPKKQLVCCIISRNLQTDRCENRHVWWSANLSSELALQKLKPLRWN